MTVFISGNPGAGKSTLAAELTSRGIAAVDSDEVPGLAAWMNSDGDVVGDASLVPSAELLATCYWGWSASRLARLLDELEHGGAVLGIAQNQWEHIERFDGLVLLEMDEATQRQRVASRDALVQKQILAGLPVFQAQMVAHGAFRIAAAQPPAAVADQVVVFLSER